MDPKDVRAMREILASEPKAIFHVVHYGNQVCAEVDPSFVLQFWNELRSLWHIIDYSGIYNIIWCYLDHLVNTYDFMAWMS
ncbi:hypothetical protein P8452_08780 [Trifolium repens]|nr:hypothetical protein P8452_08780 [Trifolium repens]